MDKILTIVVPTYNMEKYLDRCLSSLIVEEKQMSLFEVLVINDGSNDRSSDIAHRYEDRFPDTFRAIDKENGHYGSCVNCGLKEAKGAFIKILDADDAFDTDVFDTFLTFLVSSAISSSCDLIISDYKEIDEQTNRSTTHFFGNYSLIRDIPDSDCYEWFIHALCYRTNLLRQINYTQTENKLYTDNEWAFIPMMHVSSIIKFDGIPYLYTVGRSGQSIEEKVHAKNLGIETSVILHLLQVFCVEENRMASDNAVFLKNRLILQISHLYQLYLLTYHHLITNYSPLEELDKTLKESHQTLYDIIGLYTTRIAGISFKPIHAWRNNKTVYGLFSHLYKSADRVNRLHSQK